MEIIQIEKKVFNEMFKNLRRELELQKFKCRELVDPKDTLENMSNDMHRHFNYHICRFKDELEKA